MNTPSPLPALETCQLGEGLLWHPDRQTLWWVDINRRLVFEWDLTTPKPRRWQFDQATTAVVPAAAGGVMLVMADAVRHFSPDDEKLTPFAQPPDLDPSQCRFNDAKCDPQGRLWAGTLSLHGHRDQAALLRIDPDGSSETILRGLGLSNGMAWSAAGDTFYFIDSLQRNVQAFDFDADHGRLSNGRICCDLTGLPGVPDGCTLDKSGCILVAQWGGSCLTRWDPTSGKQVGEIKLPVSQVTNCTFVGALQKTLIITSAACGLEAAQLQAESLAGHLFEYVPSCGGEALAFSFASN